MNTSWPGRRTIVAATMVATGLAAGLILIGPPQALASCVWKSPDACVDDDPPVTSARITTGIGFVQTVTVTLEARDGTGSGVRRLWVDAVGAQPMGGGWLINDPNASSMTHTLVISARGETKIRFRAQDRLSNTEDVKSVTVYI